jgi:hypothetical protein
MENEFDFISKFNKHGLDISNFGDITDKLSTSDRTIYDSIGSRTNNSESYYEKNNGKIGHIRKLAFFIKNAKVIGGIILFLIIFILVKPNKKRVKN